MLALTAFAQWNGRGSSSLSLPAGRLGPQMPFGEVTNGPIHPGVGLSMLNSVR
jgi:hypothetical protein